jgi:hypothetical protein
VLHIILNMEPVTNKKRISAFNMGLCFALAYAILIALLHFFRFSVGNSIFSLIVSPASSIIGAFLYTSIYNPATQIIVYIVSNALVYFIIGYVIGKIAFSDDSQQAIDQVVITPNATVTNVGMTPGKLCNRMFLTALAWGIIGVIGMTIPMLEELFGVWWGVGIIIVLGFLVRAISLSVQSFKHKNTALGVQFLLLLIVIPIIGYGAGCGTCYLGMMVFGGW